MSRLWQLGLIVLLMSGCMRPNYTRPWVEVPCDWRFESDDSSTLYNAVWWQQFNDPVLDHYIWLAIENNQDIKQAVARVFEFYAHLGVVNSAVYPEVNGNAIYTRNRASQATPIQFPSGVSPIFNDYQAFFNLSWELDFWGRVASASEAAYADLLRSVQTRRAVVLTVVSSVANAYITLRGLDSQLAISRQTQASREESLKLAITRFELGETSELEVVQAKAELEIAILRVIQLERDIPLQENLLSILLGENPRDLERGLALDAFKYPPVVPAGLPSDLLARRPDIVEKEDQLIAANARIAEARALYFPQITLTGMYGVESDQLSQLLTAPARMWQYGLSAVQTIFNAGKTTFQVQEAEAVYLGLLAAYRETILIAFKEVDDALIAYQKDLELVAEHEKQVEILSQYVHLATLRYQEGEVDYLNVLDAQRTLFDAQLSLVQAQADSFNAIVDLYGALGGGWVDDADAAAITEAYCE